MHSMHRFASVCLSTALTTILVTEPLLAGQSSGSASPARSEILLIDFGASPTTNVMPHRGWQSPIMDRYTDYRDIGPGGATIVTGESGGYNYQGITGTPLLLEAGHTIQVEWYNNSGEPVLIAPRVSLNDPDRVSSGLPGTWFDMSATTIESYSSGTTAYSLDSGSDGIALLVNVNVAYDNTEVIVCDRIVLSDVAPDSQPPTAPQNISATVFSPYQIDLDWDPATDNTNVLGYFVYRYGQRVGWSFETSYADSGLDPATLYSYQVTAFDNLGNESIPSHPDSAITLDGDPIRYRLIAFDTMSGNHADGFDNWHYANTLGYHANVGGYYSDPDLTGHVRNFVPYYNHYNSDHMGWLRWGFLDVSDQVMTGGTGRMRFVLTGGAYDDADAVAFSGLEVTNKEQYEAYLAGGLNPYADVGLPGGMAFYALSSQTSSTHSFDEAQGTDRLSVWVFLPRSVTQEGETRPKTTFSWYPFIDDGNGGHYYHWAGNVGLGGWTHVLFDAHPQHHNGGDPDPYDQYRVGGYHCPGEAVEYFERTVKFALRVQPPIPCSPAEVMIDEVEFYNAAQPENDETIATIGVGYNPSTNLFDISYNDKYRCGECSALYEVRYSFQKITNDNFPAATLAAIVDDPDIEFTYSTGIPGEIIKPVNGYSLIWAMLALAPEDEAQLAPGVVVHFAVKDISTRTFPDQDPYDEEFVVLPHGGTARRVDLIKTIDYTIHPEPLDWTCFFRQFG